SFTCTRWHERSPDESQTKLSLRKLAARNRESETLSNCWTRYSPVDKRRSHGRQCFPMYVLTVDGVHPVAAARSATAAPGARKGARGGDPRLPTRLYRRAP